jgi:chromosome segregation ATPase
MSLRQWLLAGAIAMAGCATTGGVSDNDVARLSVADRTQIITAHKSIDVAESNLDSAKVARDEAKQFRKIALSELDASKSRLEAARSSVDLGKSARDDRALREASRNEDAARDQLIASRAKLDYADRLVELREAKITEAEANLNAAKADVDMTKLQLVQRNGMAADVDAKKLEARRQDAQERLAEARAHVAQIEGETAQLKTAWDDRRNEVNRTASRGGMTAPPPPPAEMPMPTMRWRDTPRGDVNDTPAAPETKQSQEPQNNIAPAP